MNKLFAYGRIKSLKIKKVVIVVFTIALLATLAFIWGNSLKDRSQSVNQSDKVVEIIKPDVEQEDYFDLSSAIRSMGHFLEFCLLGFEIFLFSLLLKKFSFQSVFNACMLTLTVAVIDEALQLLNDRVADIVDVLIDFCGGVAGVAFAFALFTIICLIKRKKEHCSTADVTPE